MLFTRLLYESFVTFGTIVKGNEAVPEQPVPVSVAMTVIVNWPVADGMPLSEPATMVRLMPGGCAPDWKDQ